MRTVTILMSSESYESDVICGVYEDLAALKAANPEIEWWDQIDGVTLAEARSGWNIVADGQRGSVYNHYFALEWDVLA